MTDIIHGERLKKGFRFLLNTGLKFFKRDMQMVADDLRFHQNPVIKNLNTILLIAGQHLEQKDQWQRRTMVSYGQSLLWVVIKDTAYRDPFFWMINEILKHPEEMKKMIAPYVRPPKEWTANQWENSKKKSEKLRKEGKVPKIGGKSLEETLFVPEIQKARLDNLLKKKKK